jgi:hypothetical protein
MNPTNGLSVMRAMSEMSAIRDPRISSLPYWLYPTPMGLGLLSLLTPSDQPVR